MSDVIILFNGIFSSKLWWEYSFEGNPVLRKLDFLDNLKKIGNVFAFNQPFFNTDYYYNPEDPEKKQLWAEIYKNYEPFSPNIDFNLEDLNYKNICEKIYRKVSALGYKKYIVIGHSYGGPIGLLFCKLYKSRCILCCCIDNPPYLLSFFKKFNEKLSNELKEKFSTNKKLKKILEIIQFSEDKTLVNNEINNLNKFLVYRSCQDRIKYFDSKLYVPTIFFRALQEPENNDEKSWNLFAAKEEKFYKNKSNYSLLKGAGHFIWEKQKFSDLIIEKIKEFLLQ